MQGDLRPPVADPPPGHGMPEEDHDMTINTEPRSADSARLADAARNVADQAEQTVEAKASTAMEQVSGAIGGIAHAIRRAGEDLRQEQPQLASVADTAAVQVDRIAEYLEQHEPREVFEDVQDAARRQPALLIGGGIAFGLVVGRLLRSAVPGEADVRGSTSGRARRDPYTYNSRFQTGMSGNGGSGQTSDPGMGGPSIIASTRPVEPGSRTDTGATGDPSRR
jgi:hypothetical protein